MPATKLKYIITALLAATSAGAAVTVGASSPKTNPTTMIQHPIRLTAITLLFRWYNLCVQGCLYACNQRQEQV